MNIGQVKWSEVHDKDIYHMAINLPYGKIFICKISMCDYLHTHTLPCEIITPHRRTKWQKGALKAC